MFLSSYVVEPYFGLEYQEVKMYWCVCVCVCVSVCCVCARMHVCAYVSFHLCVCRCMGTHENMCIYTGHDIFTISQLWKSNCCFPN